MLVTLLLSPCSRHGSRPTPIEAQNLDLGATPPSAAHWLGTDIFGRDLLTQIMYGGESRWQLVCRNRGRPGDRDDLGCHSRLCRRASGCGDDALGRHPVCAAVHDFIVLLMVVFGRNMLLLFLAIGAVEWLTMARIMRCQVQSLRQQEFVEAAISLGCLRHHYPAPSDAQRPGPDHCVYHADHSQVMLLEAFLSFLGLGIQPPQTSWGLLILMAPRLWKSFPGC